MAGISPTVWAATLDRAAAGGFRQALERRLVVVALDAEARGKRLATSRLRRRTGRLAASIRSRVRAVNDGVQVEIQAGGTRAVPYARMQEVGGTIKARRSKYLAIPLGPAKTGAGVSKYTSPRRVPGLFPIKVRGKLFLVKRGGSKRLEFWYKLQRSVRLRGRHYLRDAINGAVEAGADRALGLAFRDAVEVP